MARLGVERWVGWRFLLAVPLALGTVACWGEASNHPAGAGSLSLEEAERYVLELLNRDRKMEGLTPLTWDPAAAWAATRHARDMAAHGFTAHWGTDGSVPEQRYSEAGGTQLVRENAACYFDGQPRELEEDPRFSRFELAKIQSAFMSEAPPEDGHRRNILQPTHTRAGIGLAQVKGVRQPCMVQKLLGVFGDFDALPTEQVAHGSLHVAGEVHEPIVFGGVGVKRLPPPEPLTADELNSTSTYSVPEPDVVYFPPGFKTPLPVQVEGRRFSVDVPLGEPGMYAVSVWGRFPDAKEQLRMVSLRTVRVR